MKICKELSYNGSVAIAFGFFDGIHIGHRKVISDCVEYAEKNGLKSAVLTFREHPCVSMWNVKPQYIIPSEQRIALIKGLGVDYLYIIDFDKTLSELSPEQFLKMINSTISPKAVFTGFNFMFGRNKSGNSNTLKELSKVFEYKYFEIPEQKINNITISSTNIRNFLKKGEISEANALLGYEFNFSSNVYEGKKIGHKIGFPTINLIYPDDLIEFLPGVYSAKVAIDNKLYDGILNFGAKPTISNNKNIIPEVHILNFNSDIYGKNVKVFPKKFIREQRKFESLDALKNQIQKDIKSLKNIIDK